MNGVLLAGGTGSRLWPVTRAVSKQLLPVWDKPMIYYPLHTLIVAGVRNILIVTRPDEVEQFRRLLGDGSQWGLRLGYQVQDRPRGIAHALVLAADHLDGGPAALVLGDNVLHGPDLDGQLRPPADGGTGGALIFAAEVRDPRQYGVVELDAFGRVRSIEEKPALPRARYAVPGLYYYDGEAAAIAAALTPSARGELEITDVHAEYLARGRLRARMLRPGTAWFDTGTFAGLAAAGDYVRDVQERYGIHVGCVEEAAWRAGLIDDDDLRSLAVPLCVNGHGDYLLRLLDRPRQLSSIK